MLFLSSLFQFLLVNACQSSAEQAAVEIPIVFYYDPT